jgi:hypothetical protein
MDQEQPENEDRETLEEKLQQLDLGKFYIVHLMKIYILCKLMHC